MKQELLDGMEGSLFSFEGRGNESGWFVGLTDEIGTKEPNEAFRIHRSAQ